MAKSKEQSSKKKTEEGSLEFDFVSEDTGRLSSKGRGRKRQVRSRGNSSDGEIQFTEKHDMKPHSEAKVTLYRVYIERYLAIIGLVPSFTKINVYDVFCGTGIYRNGKFGSPIVAYNAIQKTKGFFESTNKIFKTTTLTVNDGNIQSIGIVSSYLSGLNKENPCCKLDFHNKDASEMIDIIIERIKREPKTERNLIFIDPTGYKEIHRDDILKLMRFGTSEVILFLPVSHIHRFSNSAQQNEHNAGFRPLKGFIHEFFEESHPIRQGKELDVHQFVEHISEALKFGKYYATSFFLQRNAANYYALFFITSNLLGLEKIIEAKWKIDPERGEGFLQEVKLSESQMPIFPEVEKTISNSRLTQLKSLLTDFITSKSNCSNCELYEYTLTKGFRPTHANQILTEWQNNKAISVLDIETNQPARKKSFYLNYDCYKINRNRVVFKFL